MHRVWDPVARRALTVPVLQGRGLSAHPPHTPNRAVSCHRPLQGRGQGGGFSPPPVAGGQQVPLPSAASACAPGTAAPRCWRGLLRLPPRLPCRGDPRVSPRKCAAADSPPARPVPGQGRSLPGPVWGSALRRESPSHRLACLGGCASQPSAAQRGRLPGVRVPRRRVL